MKRVLIVSKNMSLLSRLDKTLASMGYETAGLAASVTEAIDKAAAAHPDIILMDIDVSDSIDGVRAGLSIEERIDIPVLFISNTYSGGATDPADDHVTHESPQRLLATAELRANIETTIRRKRSAQTFKGLYEDLVENSSDFIYVIDGMGTIVYLNRTACHSLGRSLEQLIGKNFKELVVPESYDYSEQVFRKRLRGEDVGTFELKLYDRDGNIRTIETRERPIWQEGRIVEIHGIARDVTERKKTEEALRKSEERYRIITQNMHDTVWVLDNSFKPVFVSPSVEEARGYSLEEIKSLPLQENLTPHSYDMIVTAIVNLLTRAKAGAGQSVPPEVTNLEWIRKDGTTYWTEVALSVISDESGNPVEILGIGRDITERRRGEQALRESEERYRALFEDAPFGIFHSHPDGYFLRVNSALARILGYDSPEEVISTIRDFKNDLYVNPDDRRKSIEEMARQKGWGFFEADWRRKDGSVIIARVHIHLAFAPDGAFQYVEGFFEDITERKQAEQALRESEQRYRLLAENVNDILFTMDMNLRFTYITPSITRLRGFTPQEVLLQTPADILTPASLSTAMEALKEEMEMETHGEKDLTRTRTVELEQICKNGSTIWTEVIFSAMRGENGSMTGIVGVARDITERRKAEAAIRASEERYRLLAEYANDIIFTTDMNLMFTYISPSVSRIRGFSVEEAMSQMPFEAITPASWEVAMNAFRDEMEIEKRETKDLSRMRILELEDTRKDGSTIWTETMFSFMRDEMGEATGIVGITRDITERKKTQEALRQSEEKFRNLFETSRDFLFIADLDGKVLEYNSALRDIFGYSDEEIGRLNLFDTFIYPEERALFIKKAREGTIIDNYEMKLMKKDGATIDALITVVPRRDAKKKIFGLQGTIKDVTQMKRLEMQLLQSEKLSGLGTMISGIAHELNNPLTAIMGNAELLLLDNTTSDRDIKSMEVIFKESERAARIVNGLLTFAREHRPERKVININDVIMESYKLRQYNFKINNIDVGLSLSDNKLMIYADPYQLQQVFTNIINNACDALMDKGGGKLTIRSELRGKNVIVEFIDNGPGIDKNILNKIFDPFFTTKDVGKGTGLGLSMAYGILNEHGGTIDVRSEPGSGTKFTVEIPVVRRSRKDAKASNASDGISHAGKSVLIIDDEQYIRDLLFIALLERGYHVQTAADAETAFSVIEKEEFDIIVADIRMPGMGGKDIYAHIQREYPQSASKMLFITGDVLSPDTKEFLDSTKNRYIEKPFRINDFIKALNSALDS